MNNTLRREQVVKPLKRLSVIVSALLIISITMFIIPNKTLMPTSGGATLYVGGSGFGNHSTIQEAIDAAIPGDTVYVYPTKIYYENIIINKSINLIGEKNLVMRPIIEGIDLSDHVVFVTNVNHFNMSGFEVRNNSVPGDWAGIRVNSSSNVNIYDNIVYDCNRGVEIILSSFVNIESNEIHNNVVNGIESHCSSNNNFINNTVHHTPGMMGSAGHGFFFSGTPYYNNKIIGNMVYNNKDGIHLEDQTVPEGYTFWNNSIIDNTVYNNGLDGISIWSGTNNFVINNTVHHNGLGTINPWGGISIRSSLNNSIVGNTVNDNDHGILIEQGITDLPPTNNTIAQNIVYNNEHGIRLIRAQYNKFIENSIFDNNNSVSMFFEWGSDYGGIRNDFINCTLTNAGINVYMPSQSLDNNFINCTLTNANINVYMEEQSRGNNFINCSLSNAIKDEFNLSEDSDAICLNTTFGKDKVTYGDMASTLTVKWFIHVKVIYWNWTPVSNAEIWVNDTYGTKLLDGLADSKGWIKWTVVNEYVEQDLNGDHIGERFYFTPHNVTATDGNLWGYADPNMDISKIVIIILGAPPYVLPPTNLTTKVVNNGDNVELEWEPSTSPILDHYLIYRADSATEFDFTKPYNGSTTWPDPKNTTWVDPDPTITAVDDDFYYIVRAANFDESDISTTSNTAGVWTRTFQAGTSTFSLPLEPFVKRDVEFYCQDMNASYIKWMNQTTHTWVLHNRGQSENNTIIEMGEGYEIGFLGKSGTQTRYTFTGMPGAMIIYDDDIRFSGFDPATEAKNLTVSIEPGGNVTLNWEEPSSMGVGDWYEVYYSNERDGFFKTLGVNYSFVCPPVYFGNNTATHEGAKANDPGARLYYMVVPFNSMGIRGASTYSIGIWTEEYLSQYDTMGIPLKLSSNHTADWYCDNIPDTVGINYYMTGQQRWGWHSTRMPGGAYDVFLEMAEGYQISTSNATKFTFIGV